MRRSHAGTVRFRLPARLSTSHVWELVGLDFLERERRNVLFVSRPVVVVVMMIIIIIIIITTTTTVAFEAWGGVFGGSTIIASVVLIVCCIAAIFLIAGPAIAQKASWARW